MENNLFDIGIIGGGPAGSCAAYVAEKLGLKVVILDRQKFPRDKICGDVFTTESFQWLKEFDFNFSGIENLKSSFSDKKMLFEDAKGDNFKMEFPFFFLCKRFEMDNYFWESIPKSVLKIEEAEINPLTLVANQPLKINYTKNGEKKSVDCKYIIGADGYSSMVKRSFFPNLKYNNRVACRYYTSAKKKNNDLIGFYFYPEISPGYFWIFPLGDGSYNTGVYLSHDSKLNIKEIHTTFYKKHFNDEINENNFHVWPIPNNINLNILATNRVLLTGDAAGLCDYLIGHGIDTAILTGIMAAKSIDYFEKRNNGKYELSEIYSYHLSCYKLNKLLERSKKLYIEISEGKRSLREVVAEYLSKV
jgi:geranylgeranyl reductase family protein